MTFEEILESEQRSMHQPCKYVNGWESYGYGHHIMVLLYEHASDVLGPQLRLATAIDGRIVSGLIVGDKGWAA